MKNKLILGLLSCILAIGVVVGFGGCTKKESIVVGIWHSKEEWVNHPYASYNHITIDSYFEFFENGTFKERIIIYNNYQIAVDTGWVISNSSWEFEESTSTLKISDGRNFVIIDNEFDYINQKISGVIFHFYKETEDE